MRVAPGITDPVANHAIEWMVLMRSGSVTALELSEFESWCRADPRHEAACRRIERVLGGMTACPVDKVAREALIKSVTRCPDHASGRSHGHAFLDNASAAAFCSKNFTSR